MNNGVDLNEIVKILTTCINNIKELTADRESHQLDEFVGIIDEYIKYMENTIELDASAEKALQGLIELKEKASL